MALQPIFERLSRERLRLKTASHGGLGKVWEQFRETANLDEDEGVQRIVVVIVVDVGTKKQIAVRFARELR